MYASSQITNNDLMYKVQIQQYFHQGSSVVYKANFIDLTKLQSLTVYFRYDTMKKLHKSLIQDKDAEHYKDSLPDFPKTHSFWLWNRTNQNSKLLAVRKQELEFYLNKLLNHPQTRRLKKVKQLISQMHKKEKQRDRSTEMLKNTCGISKRSKSQQKMKTNPYFIKLIQIK